MELQQEALEVNGCILNTGPLTATFERCKCIAAILVIMFK